MAALFLFFPPSSSAVCGVGLGMTQPIRVQEETDPFFSPPIPCHVLTQKAVGAGTMVHHNYSSPHVKELFVSLMWDIYIPINCGYRFD